MKRLRIATALITVGALALTSCGDSDAADNDTYRIVVVASQTGPLAAQGGPFLRGLKVARDELNAEGGIDGRKVELKVLDSASDPTKAVSLLQKELASGNQPDLVWDGTTSAETLAMLPVLTSKKILSIGSTGNDDINDPGKYPYAFHASADQNLDGGPANAGAMLELGCKNAGLLAPNDASGEPVREAYPSAFEEAGVKLTIETYAPTDLDMTAPLARLRDAGVECVSAYAAGPTAPHVAKSRAQLGWDVPLVFTESMTADLFSLVKKDELDGVSLLTYAPNAYQKPADRTAAYSAFIEGLEKQDKINTAMINFSWPHDLLRIVALAVKQAGSTDADKVKEAMESLEQPADADKPYISYATMGWSADNHFIDADPKVDFKLINPVTPLVDGTWK